MSRRARRNPTPGFKAKVALAAIKGDRTLAQRFRRPRSAHLQPNTHLVDTRPCDAGLPLLGGGNSDIANDLASSTPLYALKRSFQNVI